MDEAAVMNMFERLRTFDENVSNVLDKRWIIFGREQFKVVSLDVLHGQEVRSVDLAVSDVTDDKLVVMNLAEHFTAAKKTTLGGEIKCALVLKPPHRQRLLLLVGGEK